MLVVRSFFFMFRRAKEAIIQCLWNPERAARSAGFWFSGGSSMVDPGTDSEIRTV